MVREVPYGTLSLLAACALATWYIYNSRRRESVAKELSSPRVKDVGATSVPDESKKLVIYFGSQTGTSETLASDLAVDAEDHNVKCEVRDLDDFNEEILMKEQCVVFIQSTYGEGDPTDSAQDFFEWLQDAEEGCLCNMRYAVFACGNRQYTEFNKAGKDVDTHLDRLGGRRMLRVGLGDDDIDIEEDFSKWREILWEPLMHVLVGRGRTGEIAPKVKVLPLEMCIAIDGQSLPKDRCVLKEGNDTLAKWIFQSYKVPVGNIRELCQQPDEQKTTVHMDLDISRSRLVYNTADNAEILAHNPQHLVLKFASLLKCDHQLEHFISWSKSGACEKTLVKAPFPTPCTVQAALEQYSDLVSLPNKNTLIQFALKLEDPARVIHLLQSAQFKMLARAHISFLDFWETFLSSLQIDLSTFLQLCPRAKMRPYTISSSSKEQKKTVGLTISLLREELEPSDDVDVPCTKFRRVYEGTCSSMVCKRPPERVRLQIRSSQFQLPAKKSWPIIMIAAGTGVAPFRGFLREFRIREVKPDAVMLFFGCQRRDTDFIYGEELEEANEFLPNYQLITAFSREQNEKVYVQHRLAENGEAVRTLLENGAFLYVCGATKMGKKVEKALEVILQADKALSVEILRKSKRYVEELWG